MTPAPATFSRPRGFTLVELLVVIAIIAVLIGIAFVALGRAQKQAQRASGQFQLNSIAVALDAYRADFGDYPRLPKTPSRAAGIDDGSYLLTRALIAPAPAATDGFDGPGFRAAGGGPVRQPYLSPDKFKVVQGVGGNDNTWRIVDKQDRPVAYYAGRIVRPDVSLPAGYVAVAAGSDDNAAFDLSYCDPAAYFAQGRVAAAVMLGDTNADGSIGPGETGVDEPYLLWSAGEDGVFGPTAITPVVAGNTPAILAANRKAAQACDDITNFKR